MRLHLRLFFCLAMLWTPLQAQDTPKNMPKENVVEVSAIGEGLCVSNAFQSNMVVQRDKPLNIWGWASPGEDVTISFAGKTAKVTAGADRSWKATLEALPANSTPGSMTITGKDKTLKLENILVGDVWILGGQSNMEFDISKVNDGMLEIASANFPEIRLLTMPVGMGFKSVKSFERLYEWSDWSKRHFHKGAWEVCTPETVKEFSAIGYTFGRRIQMATRVPIGLIDTSIGGTTVETWTPEKVIRGIQGEETKKLLREWNEKIALFDPKADLQRQIAKHESRKQKLAETGKTSPADSKPPTELRPGPAADKNRPGWCYASVIEPLEGLSAKGAVFHQGFNNCFNGSEGARMYDQVFGEMIRAWRCAFMDESLPFCVISLCTAGEPQTSDNFLVPMHDVGALIREAQYRTFRKLRDAGDKDIGFASSFDFRKSFYHPQIKIPVGERAAKWALASQYGLLGRDRDADSYWLPPSIEKMETQGDKLVLTMSTEVTTKDDSDGKMLGFAIAGENKRFHPADIQYLMTDNSGKKPVYDRKTLILTSPYVSKPQHYRYAWARNPMANIVNSKQIPISTQRSDDWILEETPTKYPLKVGKDGKSQAQTTLIRRELQLGDTERRIHDAKRATELLEKKFQADKEALEKEKAKQLEKQPAK